jgi:hypothetical protein
MTTSTHWGPSTRPGRNASMSDRCVGVLRRRVVATVLVVSTGHWRIVIASPAGSSVARRRRRVAVRVASRRSLVARAAKRIRNRRKIVAVEHGDRDDFPSSACKGGCALKGHCVYRPVISWSLHLESRQWGLNIRMTPCLFNCYARGQG